MLCSSIDCCFSIKVQECIFRSSGDDEVQNLAFSGSQDGSVRLDQPDPDDDNSAEAQKQMVSYLSMDILIK